MLRDTLYAIRGFRRAPGFALTVIVTIGLALGLNTTLFTIFNAYRRAPWFRPTGLAVYGIALGALLALGVSHIFASLLTEINTYEPLAYASAIIAVFLATVAASLVPTFRAARIDPASTLRSD